MKVLNYEGLQLYHDLANNEFANKKEVEQDITNLKDGKVDKEGSKVLSTNDFTNELKTKLEGIEQNANNYNLPVASSALGGIKSGGDITVAADGTVNIKDNSHNHTISNINELQNELDGIHSSINNITPEKIGALNKEEYLGPVVLEGNPIVYERGTEGLGIAAVSYLEPKQAGNASDDPAHTYPNLRTLWFKHCLWRWF